MYKIAVIAAILAAAAFAVLLVRLIVSDLKDEKRDFDKMDDTDRKTQ